MRQTNEVAHTLARADTLSVSLITYYHAPHCIEQVINNEML